MVQESSVESFGAVHAKVQEGDNEQETARGASLRELQRFFKEHDGDKGYAGLRRIADEDGTAVWTLLKETEVAAQLERRARERREEEQRRDDLFSALARTPSEAANDLVTLRAELKAAREKEAQARGEAETARKEAEMARREVEGAQGTPSPSPNPSPSRTPNPTHSPSTSPSTTFASRLRSSVAEASCT